MLAIDSQRRLEVINAVTAANETLPKSVPPQERISVITLNEQKGRIIDSVTGKPIEEVFARGDAHFSRETEVNLAMLYALLKASPQSLGLWLSPPIPERGVPTGKILVAGKREISGRGQIVEYDVTGLDFSPKEYFDFYQVLKPYYQNGYFLVDEIPWETLSAAIPMPKAWEKMRNGLAEEEFNANVEKWSVVIDGKSREIYIPMMDRELGSNIRSACPTPNEVSYIKKAIDKNGNELHYVEHCGNCGAEIFNYIKKGDKCREVIKESERRAGKGCDGVYEGC